MLPDFTVTSSGEVGVLGLPYYRGRSEFDSKDSSVVTGVNTVFTGGEGLGRNHRSDLRTDWSCPVTLLSGSEPCRVRGGRTGLVLVVGGTYYTVTEVVGDLTTD